MSQTILPHAKEKNCQLFVETWVEKISKKNNKWLITYKTTQGTAFLEAQKVNYQIGDFKILKNIDLKIYEGEKVVIMGPSGSGKSTLLKTLNWITIPDKGDIYFERKLLFGCRD